MVSKVKDQNQTSKRRGNDLTVRLVTNRQTTNDGQRIPTGKQSPMNAGYLDRTTKYSNTEAFERYGHDGAPQSGAIEGMHSWMPNENLDDPGLDANGGCFHKWGTPYGEAAMFNQLPPGPDINDQAYALIHEMPLELYHGGVTYASDTPWPVRDVSE
jgi:hypothetical protein